MIEGLSIVDDWITPREETLLALECDRHLDLGKREPRDNDGRSRCVRYGVPIYPGFMISPTIPPWLAELGARLPMATPEQVTINDWGPLAQLDFHIDRGGPIICVIGLSGLGYLTFEDFRMGLGGPHELMGRVRYRFPRRAMMKIEGPARYSWRHAVTESPERRISLVFRTVR